MDYVWITLGAWAAFAVAALIPGFFLSQFARRCPEANA